MRYSIKQHHPKNVVKKTDKSKVIVGINIIVLNKYFKYNFLLSKDIITEIIITKNGFKVSIG